LRRAGGLVTNRGGRTCHAAIISRELGIPAVIGTKQATTALVDGTTVTLDCSTGIRGAVYAGACPFTVEKFALDTLPHAPVPVYVNIGDPETVFRVALLPVDGVGLARLEFIIASLIGVHPMACARPELVTDEYVREQIQQKLRAKPEDWKAVFVRELAEAMGTIAGAFYPRPVTIRCSDFKSNEYRGLLGGRFFEGLEENPMLGFRGAARYFSDAYAPAFVLECEAIHYARTQMGLDNIKLLVPFVRSVDGARRVVEFLAAHNLRRGEQGLEVLMMVETPENVLTLDLFAPYFDGFSIGSNDLTQLTLGVDRDSAIVQHLFDEQSPGVVMLVSMAIQKARAMGKPIGICGQAPSDFPDFARMLIEAGITSVSMTPDSVIPFLLKFS
jgi:pyruvate,water dikinase